MSGYGPLLIASKIGSGISNHLPDRDIMSRQFDDTDTWTILIMTGLPGVGANPIPNCKLGFGLRVHSNCVQTLSSLINYVGENELLV